MAKFAAKDSNKNITLSPHGTGKVVVGTGAADATVQSDGNHNLVLQTGNSTTGSISITDGANGNIAITPNGTGEVDISKVDIDAGAIDGVTIGTNSEVTELRVDNIKVDGNTISSTNTDGNISITPNGTGELVVGSGSASGKITSSGAHDLVIDTNSGTNSGTISIVDGANGNINITPNGTGRTVITNANLTSPQLTTQINDSNANALIKVTANTGAVNEISVANAGTGEVPSITSTGDDTSVNLLLDCKGNGEVSFGANTNFSSKTDAKIMLPTAGGIHQSNTSTEILMESSGAVTLKNTAIDSSNSITFPDGHILQVVSAQKSDSQNSSDVFSSGNWTDATGLSVSLTPSSATNYLFIQSNVQGSNRTSSYAFATRLYISGGGTDGAILIGDTEGSRSRVSAGGPNHAQNYVLQSYAFGGRIRLNDTTPNWSSGALTIKVQFATNNSGNIAQINRAGNESNSSAYTTTTSNLTVMEIKG